MLHRGGSEARIQGVDISGMRERVAQLQGQIGIYSTSHGTVVDVILPLTDEPDPREIPMR